MESLSIFSFIVEWFFKIFSFLPHKNKKFEAFKEQFKSVAFQEIFVNLSEEKISAFMTNVFGNEIHSEGLLRLREIKCYRLHKKDKRLIKDFISLFDKMIYLENNKYNIKYNDKLYCGDEIQDLYNNIKQVIIDAKPKRSSNKN